jgi:hypothetical protein
MKIKLHHLPSNTVIESDRNDESFEDLYETINRATSDKLSNLQITVNENLMFIPSKILDESIITIIEE